MRDRVKRYGRIAVGQAGSALAFGFVMGALSILLFLLLGYRVWKRLQGGNDPMDDGVRRRAAPAPEDR